MPITMTYELAHAAATDAGNRHMMAAGRFCWDASDYDACMAEFNRLWPVERDLKEPGRKG